MEEPKTDYTWSFIAILAGLIFLVAFLSVWLISRKQPKPAPNVTEDGTEILNIRLATTTKK